MKLKGWLHRKLRPRGTVKLLHLELEGDPDLPGRPARDTRIHRYAHLEAIYTGLDVMVSGRDSTITYHPDGTATIWPAPRTSGPSVQRVSTDDLADRTDPDA